MKGKALLFFDFFYTRRAGAWIFGWEGRVQKRGGSNGCLKNQRQRGGVQGESEIKEACGVQNSSRCACALSR